MQLSVKFLLVDDKEENLTALTALLQRDDVELLKARSGGEALELLLKHDVALALLDVQMPDMDGFELAELMRGSERTRHVPVVFITAGARDERRLFKGYEAGAVDFLYKPIEPHILRNKAETFFQLHRQKQQFARELEQRTETLRFNEMFTAVLGHDLRNPLNAIVASAHLLQRQSDSIQVKETAARILSSGKRMSRMIEDMIDLARSRLGGGIPLKQGPTDLLALAQRVVGEHRTAFPDRRIELSGEGNLTGNWDGDRLAQVVSNLVGNALQHGEDHTSVGVLLDGRDPDRVVISVDNAGSIRPDLIPHIFEPFRGGERGHTAGEGLGLGLYIVKQIVQAHRGAVEVSCPENRTVFRVTVPREAAL